MSALAGTSLRPGDVVAGRYRLDALIGEGGTGIVVSATDRDGRRVAIKFLKTALASEEIRLRFAREASAIQTIRSEHVVLVLDVGLLAPELSGLPYMVMEFLEGKDLARVLHEDGPLGVEDAIACMLQVCAALEAAHGLGIIHRDLKPANLFLTRAADGGPHVKVVDFGISKITDPQALAPLRDSTPTFNEVTASTAVLGSPRYMAPEQIRSSKHVDARADIWSVGVVLYQLLTGRHAFEAESPVLSSVKVLTAEPEPLSAVAPHVPREIEAVVVACLAKEPEARPASARALSAALRPFASAKALASLDRIRAVRPAT